MKQFKKSFQRGFTLIEMAIVLVIIGVLIGGVVKGKQLIDDANASAETQTMQFVFQRLQAKYLNEPDTLAVTTGNAIIGKVFPPSVNIAGAVATNQFGGLLTIAPATVVTPNDSFAVTSANLPSAACQKMVSGLRKLVVSVKIGAAALTNSAAITTVTADTQCTATDPITVVFTIAKNG